MSHYIKPERAPPVARARLLLGALLALVVALGVGAPRAQAVPAEFFGTVSAAERWYEEAEWARIQSLGVKLFRFQYAQAAGWERVDEVVRRAALHGITMEPVILPSATRYPRKGTAEYTTFMTYVRESVQRYGPSGSFWFAHPELTARPWKIWEVLNEPNRKENNPLIEGVESVQPHHYAQLLIDASATIRAVDSSATVIVAGLDFSSRDMSPSEFLRRMYEPVTESGGWGSHTTEQVKAAFDGVGLHPYAFRTTFEAREGQVKTDIEEARATLRENGDAGLPLYITEMGWAVAGTNLESRQIVTPAEQARLLRTMFEWFAGQSDVKYVVWYLYRDTSGAEWQARSGLFDASGNTREAACSFSNLAGGYACGYETATYATITQTLNGQPGYVSIGGEVLDTTPGGPAVEGVYVNINFERWNGSGWEYVDTAHANVVGGHYQYNFWAKGVGRWRTRTVLERQGSFKESQSGYHEFQIKSGYRLVSRNSNRCLSLSENRATNGTPIIQWDCSPSPNPGDGQVITLVPIESEGQYFNVKINSTGKCVDVTGVSYENGARLQEYECLGAGQTNQQWHVVAISGQPPYEALIARHSGKCMDVTGLSTRNGTQLQQWECWWGGNQQWYWQAIE